MIKIAIVDDKIMQRESLGANLASGGDITVIMQARNGKDFLEKMEGLSGESYPAVVLMDIDMPVMNGMQAVEIAKVKYPDINFLMFTVFDDDERIFDSIKAGAGGYLLKDEKLDNIRMAIFQLVETGGVPMSPMIARKAMNLLMNAPKPKNSKPEDAADYNLSSRELEILKLVVDGFDSAEIAEKLYISPLTVRKHISNIYTKLHVSNKTEAVKLAVKKRWFEL
ncbi:MAG: DNA-binding response regulator [Bacteroidetes bacterium]|jgi:DNA-binding NarL/FixJ family response regulator|nr:DNA-binding response regulator [Bacteroidota bacterium]